jgi:FeS assembly SUF system protein
MAMVRCLRCGQEAPGIGEAQPYPGELGKTIAGNVCRGCWESWKKFSVNVINDYRLRPFLPQDRAVVEKHMKQYLNLELSGLNQPVLTLEGQGVAVTFNTKAEADKPVSVTREAVVDMLEQIFDPEIPVNIHDLGLIYGIDVAGDKVTVRMTLTSPHCPAAKSLPATVRESVARIPGVREADVVVVWDPPWTKEKISEEGRKILGM